ncbi:SD27140p, partial [Wolbachia endosymbiont of Drosophila ananassae]
DVTTDNPWDKLLNRNSSWLKLIHTLAYVLRFIHRMKHPSSKQTSNSLTFDEIKAARIRWLQHAQAGFQQDFQLLRANKALGNQSQLVKLSPIIDKDNLLRVGGRIQHSQLSAEAKHPILLPKNHRITYLIIEHEHRFNLHPGVSSLFVIVRQRYWIFGARNLIRKITHNCLACFRQRCNTMHQRMADLPSVRITQALPFVNTGCDYAGPIHNNTGGGSWPHSCGPTGILAEYPIYVPGLLEAMAPGVFDKSTAAS